MRYLCAATGMGVSVSKIFYPISHGVLVYVVTGMGVLLTLSTEVLSAEAFYNSYKG